MHLKPRERQFPTTMVKAYISALYGKRPSNNVWCNWRQWADVPPRALEIEFMQFCELAAIAVIRRKDSRRQLRKSEIVELARSPEIQKPLVELIKRVDAKTVKGSYVVQLLQHLGIQRSRATIYRKIPNFSTRKFYPVDWLIHQVS